MPHTSLTQKQENFCQYYLDTDNASEAYRMAYDCSQMKVETIWANACRLLKNSKVAARIDEILAERAAETADLRAAVQGVLTDIVFNDPQQATYIDPKTGKLRAKAPSQLSKRMRNAVKSMTNHQGTVSYQFHSKLEASKQLAQMNGWNAPQKLELDPKGGSIIGELRIGFDDDNENRL